jgi:hypothetical protein
MVLGACGALLVLVGAALPWARFTVFGLDIGLPGGLWPRGAASVGLAMVSVLTLRRVPWLAAVVALGCLITTWQARAAAPREVIRRTLEMEQALAPINDKLARITVPPIEPFGGVGRARDRTEVGGTVALLGGALLVTGAILRLTPERCRGCRARWRSPAQRFCPACGQARIAGPHCAHCGEPQRTGEMFCPMCGQRHIPSVS